MQTHSVHLTLPYSISWQPCGNILINDAIYSHSVLISDQWDLIEIQLSSVTDWVQHTNRVNCPQIITNHQEKLLPPAILDLFWQQGTGVDYLEPDSALRQARLMHQSQQSFQLLLLPKYIRP
ncbi:hypothetical protein OAT84_02455 [Gammaproteobacteria bacterium]|nr:hypothetical protein [Gammaproteobacteria bacterium]